MIIRVGENPGLKEIVAKQSERRQTNPVNQIHFDDEYLNRTIQMDV